jgi:hypothetical protein
MASTGVPEGVSPYIGKHIEAGSTPSKSPVLALIVPKACSAANRRLLAAHSPTTPRPPRRWRPRFLRNVLAQIPQGSRDVTAGAGDESLILVAAYGDSVEGRAKRSMIGTVDAEGPSVVFVISPPRPGLVGARR